MQSLRTMLNVFCLFPATTLKDSSQWFCIFIIRLSFFSFVCLCQGFFLSTLILFFRVFVNCHLWSISAFVVKKFEGNNIYTFIYFFIWIYFSFVIVDIRMYRPFEKLFDEDFLPRSKLLKNLFGCRFMILIKSEFVSR